MAMGNKYARDSQRGVFVLVSLNATCQAARETDFYETYRNGFSCEH